MIDKNIISSNIIITNKRHNEVLKKTLKSIEHAIKNIDSKTLDVIAIDILDAYQNIGEITGTTSSEKIIDSIFSKFCLGK